MMYWHQSRQAPFVIPFWTAVLLLPALLRSECWTPLQWGPRCLQAGLDRLLSHQVKLNDCSSLLYPSVQQPSLDIGTVHPTLLSFCPCVLLHNQFTLDVMHAPTAVCAELQDIEHENRQHHCSRPELGGLNLLRTIKS